MKKSQIKGFIYDLEHKNKNYSFDKLMKLLDLANAIYIDKINKFNFSDISCYTNSKYIFKEIAEELRTIVNLLDDGKILMAVCLLRNVYEEILYIMATSIKNDIKMDPDISVKKFRNTVINNCGKLLGENFESDDINELYTYLCKLLHMNTVKEAASYLVSNRHIKKYISYEIKYVTILIEYMYLNFLFRKVASDISMCDRLMALVAYVNFLNLMYFAGYSLKEEEKLKVYFYGKENRKYLDEKNEKIIADFNAFCTDVGMYGKSINKISKELDKQLNDNGYADLVKEILSSSISDNTVV